MKFYPQITITNNVLYKAFNKAFIPPVFECLHGHIQFEVGKHGVVVST
jgi:hypothetical protein